MLQGCFNRKCRRSAGMSGQDSMETDPAVREAIAAAFNVKQELYFTVREGHSMTMAVEAVRRMPQKEIAGLWRSYVEALARCMVSSSIQKAWRS